MITVYVCGECQKKLSGKTVGYGVENRMIFNTTLTHLKARAFDWVSRSLMKAARVFSFFHLPKMALYRFKTTRYPSGVDNLAGLITQFLSKGAPPAVFRTA